MEETVNDSEEKHRQKSVEIVMSLRALLVFISGVLLTLLLYGLGNLEEHIRGEMSQVVYVVTIVVVLLAPLCLGIVAPLTVDKRSSSLIAIGLMMNLLFLLGVAICGLAIAAQADAAANVFCNEPGVHCHIGNVATTLTYVYLAYATLLSLPSAFLTGLILKKRRTKR